MSADPLIAKPDWWTPDHWATPWPIVRQLEQEFGKFDLDPCCHPETAKAPLFFTEEDDGLRQEWRGRVFLNPPYSKPTPWLEKAIAETEAFRADLVVALLPVNTDTQWFHQLVKDRAEIRFIQGRVIFLGYASQKRARPRMPHMFAIYRPTVPTSLGRNSNDP